jgi:hypothetical protein
MAAEHGSASPEKNARFSGVGKSGAIRSRSPSRWYVVSSSVTFGMSVLESSRSQIRSTEPFLTPSRSNSSLATFSPLPIWAA